MTNSWSFCGVPGSNGIDKWIGKLQPCLMLPGDYSIFCLLGQERFGNMTRVYYKEAVGALVVFDVTRSSTFDAVSKWKHDLDTKVKLPNGNPIPSVLLANKCDQRDASSTSPSALDLFCKEAGFLGWFETSAKVRRHHWTGRWGNWCSYNINCPSPTAKLTYMRNIGED